MAIAFLANPGTLRFCAVGVVGTIGLLFALANWACLIVAFCSGRHISLVPFLGGLLLTLAALATPTPRLGWFAFLGVLLDPSILVTIGGIFSKLGAAKSSADHVHRSDR